MYFRNYMDPNLHAKHNSEMHVDRKMHIFGMTWQINPETAPFPELAAGMVHTWVGHKVTPLQPHLKVIFVSFFTCNELVMSQDRSQHTTNPINNAAMVVEPPIPPVELIR
jgi:hypothetical protein